MDGEDAAAHAGIEFRLGSGTQHRTRVAMSSSIESVWPRPLTKLNWPADNAPVQSEHGYVLTVES